MRIVTLLALLFTSLTALAGGNTSVHPVYIYASATPTIDTNAFSANDAVGGVQTLTVTLDDEDSTVVLQNLTIVDKSAQSAAMTLFFFKELPTVVGANNAAYDLTDANAALCIGHVAVAAADYKASASNSVASVKNIGLALKSSELSSAVKTGKIYVTVMTTGTPTYGGTADLSFQYEFYQ